MGNKARANVKTKDGHEIDLQHQITDTPILPSAQYLAELEQLNPGIIKWFMEETSKEAQSRRKLDVALIKGRKNQ